MKICLIIITFLFLVLSIRAQSDSIFTNVTSYRVDICTHAWDFEGLDQYQYLTVQSDNPMSDTLRVLDYTGSEYASLLLDGRKTWLKVNSNQLSIEM